MKGRQIILDTLGAREAAALMIDGRLEDLLVDADAPRPGTIYRARAARPVKGQGGIFLDTPDGSAFLRQTRGIAPGQHLLVQVTGHAEPGKAIPVSDRLLFKSRYAIVTPGAPGRNISRRLSDEARRDALLLIANDTMGESGMGLILRSACATADDEEIARDIAEMAALAEQVTGNAGTGTETLAEGDGPHLLAWRDWTEPAEIVTAPGGFASHGVLDAIDALQGPEAALTGGATLVIEPTRALVAVDVNTPAAGGAGGLAANLACARALPRQLRLRGLGGQIVIDLAPMPRKDRRTFETALRKAFRGDDIDTTLAGFTPLGHYELQRKRLRPPLLELLP